MPNITDSTKFFVAKVTNENDHWRHGKLVLADKTHSKLPGYVEPEFVCEIKNSNLHSLQSSSANWIGYIETELGKFRVRSNRVLVKI